MKGTTGWLGNDDFPGAMVITLFSLYQIIVEKTKIYFFGCDM